MQFKHCIQLRPRETNIQKADYCVNIGLIVSVYSIWNNNVLFCFLHLKECHPHKISSLCVATKIQKGNVAYPTASHPSVMVLLSTRQLILERIRPRSGVDLSNHGLIETKPLDREKCLILSCQLRT